MTAAAMLARVLARPECVRALDARGWTAVITAARAESLLGTLAARVTDAPAPVERILADARTTTAHGQRLALWEGEMARRALAGVGIVPILLKGTAYAAAGLEAAAGRSIGDLDILVPRETIGTAEAALRAAGWEPIKDEPYDDDYYRRWMHELPPLIHRERDRIIDVHHTILPLTAKPTPDAAAMIAGAVEVNGWRVLAPADMIVHAAAHLFADGDLAGGLRNLWDIHCLLSEFGTEGLAARAQQHRLRAAVERAARQAHALFETDIPDDWRRWDSVDPLFQRRLLARDGWGRATRPLTRFGFYVRSHALRMPLPMLARHLWVKARR